MAETLRMRQIPSHLRVMRESAPVTTEERELVMELCEGLPEAIHLIGWMRIIAQDFRDVNYMDLLRWLKKENLKGWNLKMFMTEKFDGSMGQTITFIRQKIHSDCKARPLFLAK